ncbi:hypothetical protein GTW69_37755 [Streptomyces sp. SID7760]|nr:hypothetical protein [Streptomyces sp. SID7760]
MPEQDEELPETYSLAEAHASGILPWKAATTRTYFKRGMQRGITAPEGITDGQTSYYTESELLTWLAAWQKWQSANAPAARKAIPDQQNEGAPHA